MVEILPDSLLQADELSNAGERFGTLVGESLPAEPRLQPIFCLIGQDCDDAHIILHPSPLHPPCRLADPRWICYDHAACGIC
ncbi:hypothetical protein HQ447_01555 [bacterium]|nr:hypothetical protein [bacterium]